MTNDYDLAQRLRQIIARGRDGGMEIDLVEDVLAVIMDSQRKMTIMGLALERIAYNDDVHAGSDRPEMWPDNVARSALNAVKRTEEAA